MGNKRMNDSRKYVLIHQNFLYFSNRQKLTVFESECLMYLLIGCKMSGILSPSIAVTLFTINSPGFSTLRHSTTSPLHNCKKIGVWSLNECTCICGVNTWMMFEILVWVLHIFAKYLMKIFSQKVINMTRTNNQKLFSTEHPTHQKGATSFKTHLFIQLCPYWYNKTKFRVYLYNFRINTRLLLRGHRVQSLHLLVAFQPQTQ